MQQGFWATGQGFLLFGFKLECFHNMAQLKYCGAYGRFKRSSFFQRPFQGKDQSPKRTEHHRVLSRIPAIGPRGSSAGIARAFGAITFCVCCRRH